jgi:hypothetical protein
MPVDDNSLHAWQYIHMSQRFQAMWRRFDAEDFTLALFGASFFIGIWYAFPMVNTVTDVWPFGGGVLRAIEAHTLLPGYGVAYGTLSFYQNYLLMVIALGLGLLFFGFDAAALKTALILNPSYSLLVPRIASALTAMFLLVIVYRFLKIHVHSIWWRLALIVLAFGNVLTVLLTRSGKMWMLSIGLGVISFIYLYRALTEEAKTGEPARSSFISILAAFLATANFSFAAVFLINIPILLYAMPRTLVSIRRLAFPVVAGAVAFLVFFALNAGNTITQVSGFVTQFFAGTNAADAPQLSVLASLMVNVRQAIEAFPLLLLAVIPVLRYGVKDVLLARLSVLYIVIYILALSLIFRADHGLALNVRHIFPLCFFIVFLIAAFRPPARWISISFLVIGLIVYGYTLTLLSIPTTYNVAYDFIEERYGNQEMRIDEYIFELTLPMNKSSYGLYATSSCGSTCAHMRTLPSDIAFRPIVVTGDSDPATVAELPQADLLIVERAIEGCMPVARLGNDVPDDGIFDIDINLGRMTLPSFYRLHQLGKNIYIYEGKTCAASIALPTDTVTKN